MFKNLIDFQQETDAMCKRKGIHLIRVSEDDKRNSDFCDELLFSRYRKITDIEELSATVCEVLQRLKVFSSCNIAADEADIRRGYYTNLKARSLLANAPRLADEWNNEKNNGLTPDMFSISSGIKVWWKCKDGHEWQASIANRLKERGCPFCANKRVLSGYNDLATTHPILVLEWNYERNGSIVPTLLTAGSNKTVWWKCKEGHEWQTSPISRQTNGCPVCAGQKVLAGFNDFASQQPSLMKEWNYEKNPTLQPYMVSKNSGKKAWWKCKKGHEWMATISSRVKGNGCPICANKVILQGYNDLASTHPELLMEWDYERNTLMSPTSVTGGSNKKIWWICNKGHHWQAFIFNRTKGHGCPYCSGRVGNFIMNIDTGEVFHSFSEASRKFSISISSISDCCKGKQKTAGGYHWKNCSNEDIKQ